METVEKRKAGRPPKPVPAQAIESNVNENADFEAPPEPERRIDAHRERLQRAAQLDHARRTQPGAWTPLPNGEFARNRAHVGFKHPNKRASEMWCKPEGMLKNPKPPFMRWSEHFRKEVPCGHRYAWMVRIESSKDAHRDNETANYHRGGRIRYIETNEIDKNCDFAVYTPLGSQGPNGNEYVTHGGHILVEILDPELAYEMGPAWADLALDRVMELPEQVRAEPDTHAEGTDVNVDLKDSKPEASGPMYRRN